MSDDQDKAQKTEPPTSKRLDDAFKKGNVPKSQETSHWFMLAGSALFILLYSGPIAEGLQPAFVQFLELPHTITVDAGSMTELYKEIFTALVKLLFLPFLLLVSAAVIGNVVQHRLVFTFEKIKPELKKISPLTGLKKIFGKQGVMNLLKAILKIAIVGIALFVVVKPNIERLQVFVGMELLDLVLLVRYQALVMLLVVLLVMAVIAVGDFVFQRYDWMENLKMSHRDIKDETKQSEGDPKIKARIAQLRMDRARQRVASAVPGADVVLTNPTHYAVALKYDSDSMDAPSLVAKGADHLALRIREIAEEHDIPVLENPPLARGLYDTVDIDQEIPPEYYKAVAEIIGYVMNLNKRMGRYRPKPRVQAAE